MELTASSLMAWWGGLAPTPNRSKTSATGQSLRDLTPNGPLQKKQDFGDRTVTQGLDTQRPITEALPWQINGLVRFAAASFVWGAKRWRRGDIRIGGMIFGAGWFLSHLGHKARRRMCPLYVAGL